MNCLAEIQQPPLDVELLARQGAFAGPKALRHICRISNPKLWEIVVSIWTCFAIVEF
jgi:hypothetical protein